MRLRLGRPDLGDYAKHFDAPAAAPSSPLSVAWAGVTTLLIDDGTSAVQVGRGARLPTLWQRCDPWN